MSYQIFSFNCLIKSKTGDLISSNTKDDVLNSIESDECQLNGLTKALQDLKKGETRNILVEAKEAYGLYESSKIILYPRKKLTELKKVGEMISIVGKSGTVRHYKIMEFHDDMVRLDGNHPLAGQDIMFEVEVLKARQAKKSDLVEPVNLISRQVFNYL